MFAGFGLLFIIIITYYPLGIFQDTNFTSKSSITATTESDPKMKDQNIPQESGATTERRGGPQLIAKWRPRDGRDCNGKDTEDGGSEGSKKCCLTCSKNVDCGSWKFDAKQSNCELSLDGSCAYKAMRPWSKPHNPESNPNPNSNPKRNI